jgi:RHS repeat-associated protein
MSAALKIESNRIDDSFYGVTSNTRNTIKENDIWTYFTDRNGLGDIIQKSNENEAHLFEYRGDKRLSKYTHIQNNIETNNTTYYWDALGRRVAKEIQTPTQTFTNVFAHEGDQDKILLSRNGNGDEYLNIDVQGIDEHLAQITPTEVKPYLTNHLGTVLNSEATNSIRATGAFGESLQFSIDISALTNPVVYSFTGRQLDVESQTYFFRDRQYEPESSSFNSIDRTGFGSDDYNLQRYVGNSPLAFVDPFGFKKFVLLSTAGGGGATFFGGEVGGFLVVDPENGDFVEFASFGIGPGISAGYAGTFEGGIIDVDSPRELGGAGFTINLFASGGIGIATTLVGTIGNDFSFDTVGSTGGIALGQGAGFSIYGTYSTEINRGNINSRSLSERQKFQEVKSLICGGQ